MRKLFFSDMSWKSGMLFSVSVSGMDFFFCPCGDLSFSFHTITENG